jgi:VTC domain
MANNSTTGIATCDSVTAPLPAVSDLLVRGRTELKYSVPGPIADAALHVARGYLRPDAFALGPQQLITSLYLDTAHLTFLRWHRERVVDRFKLRIRRYGDHAAPMLYAEVKRKTGSIVRKHRAAFPADALQAVLNGEGRVLLDPAPMEEFVRHRSRCGAVPTVLVTCVRESLRDLQDGTAVTVDRELGYQPTCRGDLIGEGGTWRSIPLPDAFGHASALIELKHVLQPQPWMADLIEQLAPWRVSFSKYAASMNASAPAGC